MHDWTPQKHSYQTQETSAAVAGCLRHSIKEHENINGWNLKSPILERNIIFQTFHFSVPSSFSGL